MKKKNHPKHKNFNTILLIPLISMLFFNGCAPVISSGKKFDLEQVPRIQDGRTTKEEVLSMFGQPSRKNLTGGTEMWMYTYTEMRRMRTFKESMDIYLGRSMSLQSPKAETLMITFKNNVVQSHSVSVSGDE